MKKILNSILSIILSISNLLINILNVIKWAIIIVLYAIYIGSLFCIELSLSYITKWIDWMIHRSMKFFRRSIRSFARVYTRITK